jgi:hypothetical protein
MLSFRGMLRAEESLLSLVLNKERFLASLGMTLLCKPFGPTWRLASPRRTFRSVVREPPASKPLASAACRVES